MDKRIELLEERTVIFLEKTKKQREKYKTERKTLFDFSVFLVYSKVRSKRVERFAPRGHYGKLE